MNPKRLHSFLLCALAFGSAVTTRADESRIHEVSFFSEALRREMPMSVVAPKNATGESPVLVLLHGRGTESSLVVGRGPQP
jgi:poly(3-hydroxybutyrate) depolymerase